MWLRVKVNWKPITQQETRHLFSIALSFHFYRVGTLDTEKEIQLFSATTTLERWKNSL